MVDPVWQQAPLNANGCCREERPDEDLECIGDSPLGATERQDLLVCKAGRGCQTPTATSDLQSGATR